jgi:DNA-binding transcriptional LysR family regulator
MSRTDLNDLDAFLAVAREKSFTRAAAQLGVSQSALSQTMRGLEERLGLRLLARTTRSVAPTEAGERLMRAIGPHLESVADALAAVSRLRQTPAGAVRISASEHAANTVLYPAVARLARDYPDIAIEVCVDNAFADIVAQRFDAGVRLGEQVEKDMVAVRVAPDMRMAIVGAPAYFERFPPPQSPRDLTRHRCIAMRLPTFGGLLPWEFEKDGREVAVRVEGALTFNVMTMGLRAALDGLGLGYCQADLVAPYVADGRLISVLEDWCAPFPGYHLYYPSRRQHSAAFAVVVEALRYRGPIRPAVARPASG